MCDKFCEQSLRSASPPVRVMVASCVTARGVVVLIRARAHLRVRLIGREHDAIAGREDRVLIVVRAEGELRHRELAVGPRDPHPPSTRG